MMSVILLLIFSIFQYSSGISIASVFTKSTGTNTITLGQYQQVQFGWTRDQLTQYVGSPGKVIQSPDNNTNTTVVEYQGPSTNINAIAQFSFWNGILSAKAQINIDFVTNYRITKEQYNIIQIGWTYQQVRATVGNQNGNVVTETRVQGFTAMVVQYTGIKDGVQKVDGIVTLGFVNEKLVTKSQYEW